MMDLDQFKRAIAIDSNVFDDVLTLCLNAAESKVQNSIGTKYLDFYADNYLYDLAVIQLADHYLKLVLLQLRKAKFLFCMVLMR